MLVVAAGSATVTNYDLWRDLPSRQLMDMGKRFYQGDRPDSALVCLNIVANRHYTVPGDSEEQRLQGMAMNMLGILYTYYFVDYNKAHRYLLQAQKIAVTLNDLRLQAATCSNLANIHWIDSFYSNDGQLDRPTIETHQRAFETALAAADPYSIILSASNLIKIAEDTALTDVVHDDIEQFLRYHIPDSMRHYEYVKTYAHAVMEQHRGNLEAAMALYDQALAGVSGENAKDRAIHQTGILVSKFHLLIKQGRDRQAMDIINGLIGQSQATGDHHLLYFYYKNLSEYYYNKRDSVAGDRYEFQALREKDIVLNQSKLLDAEKAEFLFQIDEINAEVQELSYRQQLTRYTACGIAAIAVIILGFLALLWYKYRQEQQKNHVLYEKNLALLAADEERRQQIIAQQASKSHQLGESEQSDLLHRVLYVMETCDEVFLTDFTLPRLAELVDDTRNNVSEAINQRYHTNFNGLLNEYRIREACRRINDTEHYGHLTIEAIGQSVGFKSNSNFVSNFKKNTGLTPSAYRKQSNAQSHADSAD